MHPVRIVLLKKRGNIELALVTRERQRGIFCWAEMENSPMVSK